MQGNVTRAVFPIGVHNLLYPRCISSLLINQKCLITNQKLYEKLNLPPRPKKPLSPYFKFLQQVRPTILKEYPDIKSTEIVKKAAERWNIVDTKLKEKLQQQYAEESIVYNKLRNEYENNLNIEQRQLIKEALVHISELKEEKEIKRRSKELGKPIRPMGTFLRFVNSKQSEKHKYPNNKEWIKAMSQEWKTLSTDVKAKLEEERKSEIEKFNKEIFQWEQKMINAGNLDVVRKGSLVPQPKRKFKK